MKTAMQEVLSLVKQMHKDAKSIMVESAINDVINIITQEGLPKEKEQIINSFESGYDLNHSLVNFNGAKYYEEEYIK
jgi:hypothetical protein